MKFKKFKHKEGDVVVTGCIFEPGMESGWYDHTKKTISPDKLNNDDVPFVVSFVAGKETPVLITGEQPVYVVKYDRKQEDGTQKVYTFIWPQEWFEDNYELVN